MPAVVFARIPTLFFVSCVAAGVSIPFFGLAQSFPGNAPAEIVGDWECGSAEIFLSRLASIEIFDDTYVAGLFDAVDGRLEIEWDEGGRATWSYRLASDGTLTLDDPGGPTWTCARSE